jgi:hypothetical protein
LDALGFDSIVEIDADGNPITKPVKKLNEDLKN